jgi:DMSO/TMAO reductase YedYZ molybdopterin-dependent catalytic subunit
MDDVTLPPGQHRIDGFPRFGTHLARPAPPVPIDPVIEISGAVARSFTVPLAALATLPRRELTADLHCVAGWSATDLQWEGVAFESFYRLIVEPSARGDAPVTHVVFGGLDGYRSVVSIDDALAEDVLIAEHLDGRPLDGDHGAPARLVSPSQYGFVSLKHLCRIELHTAEPAEKHGAPSRFAEVMLRSLIKPHRRARVWEEERHRHLPARLVRPVYRLLIPPIAFLCARGSRPSRGPRMRIPNSEHTSRPWRIHDLTRDFRLEDVWALPTPGGPDDFPRLVQAIASGDASQGSSRAARALFAIRWKLGELLGWDDPDTGLGSRVPTLRDRLPADLRDAPSVPDLGALPFASLYVLDDEFAAEIANRTMHGVLHLGWVPDGPGGYRGQMAVYAKPNGLLGTAYMAAIRPFRHLIVYPPMLRQLERAWRARAGDPTQAPAPA